jgi:hypothetical protein
VNPLNELGITILKGRYGTGKSTMALHLASYYVDNGYEPYKFERMKITHLKHLLSSLKPFLIPMSAFIYKTALSSE